MTFAELRTRAGILQKTRAFKLVASAIVVVLTLAYAVSVFVAANAPAFQESAETTPEGVADPGVTITNTDAAQLLFETVLKDARGPGGAIIGAGLVAAASLVVIWLGLGITYLALAFVLALVAAPLWVFEPTRDLSKLVMALVVLSASFTALMEGSRAILSGKGPVRAIARNVLAEAVRLRLSVVFIVMLIFGLAALPGLLEADQPLRYRVQSFMQYGTGGAFWLIAMLTVFFSVSTVSAEQRDKIIWQTMTKPVAPWRYILGKWLGVSALAAVLLAVSSSGVFLFVEYLRHQPALGEKEAFIAYADEGMSEDRLVLETQVLSAQRSVEAVEPELEEETIQRIIEQRVTQQRQSDPDYTLTPEMEKKFREDILKQSRMLYFAVEPGASRQFVFQGINLKETDDVPLLLRYRIDSAANEPDKQYKISFSLPGLSPIVRDTGLGHSHTLPLAPIIVLPPGPGEPMPRVLLPDDRDFSRALQLLRADRLAGARYIPAGELIASGVFAIEIANGEFAYLSDGRNIVDAGFVPNEEFFQIPGGGLTLSYPAGSYHANYARTVGVLWLKLAFLAMIGVFFSTFLSFPVASLVTFAVFLMAESADYVAMAVSNYSVLTSNDAVNPVKALISAIAHGVSWLFNVYADLKPVEKLVNGQLIGGVEVLRAAGVIGVWGLLLYVGAVLIFRKRELAIYSGQ